MAISQEYLEEIWATAKKTLPGWMYAALHQQARASSGGRASHRKPEPSALEQVALNLVDKVCFRDMDEDALVKLWGDLSGWYTGAIRQGTPTEDVARAGKLVMGAIQAKGGDIKPSALGSDLIGMMKADASIVFVGLCPEDAPEFADVFQKNYLKPLKLSQEDTWLFHLVPEIVKHEDLPEALNTWGAWAAKRLEARSSCIIVTLGKAARKALGDAADFNLPHPTAITKRHDSGEVPRKLRQITKRLDKFKKSAHTGIKSASRQIDELPAEHKGTSTPTDDNGFMQAQIFKVDPSKHIVFGVVMDPYGASGAEPDAHNDYLPPSMIENAAHAFMLGDRVIGRQHEVKTNAQVVESWVEQYPSRAEYLKAVAGMDHKVHRRPFGDDKIHSGSWVLGVKLGDDEWAAYERGELNAFSPGGVGYRQIIEPAAMPQVEFVDLVEELHG